MIVNACSAADPRGVAYIHDLTGDTDRARRRAVMWHDRPGTPGGADEGARDDDARTISRTQRLINGIVPRSAATAIENESRTWMVRCRSCGFERSL